MYCPELHYEEQLECIKRDPADLIQSTGDIEKDDLIKKIIKLEEQLDDVKLYQHMMNVEYSSGTDVSSIKELFDMYAFEDNEKLSKDAIKLKHNLLDLAKYISDKYKEQSK